VLEAVLCLTGLGSAAGAGAAAAPVAGAVATAGWSEATGGYVTYLTSDEELMTVLPAPNSLSLVLCEPGVMSFVKHVSAAAPEPRYDVAMQFLVVT